MDVMKLMVVALAGWINQQQEGVIDYATCRRPLGGMLRYYHWGAV